MHAQSFSKFNKNGRNYILLIIVIAVVFRSLPELIAYPYPIGYDVINYYIPFNTNFDKSWNMISNQFPLYISLLHLVTTFTMLGPELVVRIVSILVFGIFSISVYQTSRRLLSLSVTESFLLALFVIFQVSILRTSWDLHRDMLALTTLLFAFAYGLNNKNMSNRTFVSVIALCIISVMTDRMIGALLTASLVIYCIVWKNRKCIILTTVSSIIFLIALFQGSNEIIHNLHFSTGLNPNISTYNPANLLVLFIVTNLLLIPTGIIGFLKAGYISLKIPLIMSLICSFSWVLMPFESGILPDRWTFVFSIFLAIFAGYGFIILIDSVSKSQRRKETLRFSYLIPFFLIGLFFAISSSDNALSFYAPIHEYVGQFSPMTMQYNSISIPESKSITLALDWINHNTPIGSNIFGNKHWRGWMDLELKDRSYAYFYNLTKLISFSSPDKYWLTRNNESLSGNKNVSLLYNNQFFSVYKLN